MELAETFLAAVSSDSNDEIFSSALRVLTTLQEEGRRHSIFRGDCCRFLENKNDFLCFNFLTKIFSVM
jgi:hypothetical protein